MGSRRPLFSLFLFLFFVLSLGTPVHGQIPGLTSTAAPSTTEPSAVPPDPLKRETPRGSILGFIKAAGEERYDVAIQYFQPPTSRHRPSLEDEEELASQLFTVLSVKFNSPLDVVSNSPLGRLDDGLSPNEERIGGIRGLSEDFPVDLIRTENEQGQKLWYISRKTLDKVPELYDTLEYPALEKQIPKTLVQNRFLAMPLWQWLAFLLFAPFALLLGRAVTFVGQAVLRWWGKRRGETLPPGKPFLRPDPVTLAVAIFLHYRFVAFIGTSILYRLYYRRIVFILFAIAFYWILTKITRLISRRIGTSLGNRGMFAERSIVSLLRRFTEIVIFLFVILIVLRMLGVDVTPALAGLGIGGLALGLGAQKTFENVFGGISILFDKVIVVGDVCKVNNQTGTVEDIGLRSTRLRTPERTVLSIPNGIMASTTLENLRFRDKFLCQQVIRLRYDLSPDHIRYVLEEIRELLRENPKVEDATSRVRFMRLAEYAIEVEIFCYILEPEFNAFATTQEALLFSIMEAIDKAGAVVALPTQTTFVNQDSWVSPEKAKAAKAAVEKIRDPGVPGMRSIPPNS
jgi:MscS family membrane protein